MTSDERHRRVDAARVHARLSVQDLWLRYLALGGTGDAFDLDGYLQGLVPLDAFQQDVLVAAVNEALTDLHRSLLVPLGTPTVADGADDGRLRRLMERLLTDPAPEGRWGSGRSAAGGDEVP